MLSHISSMLLACCQCHHQNLESVKTILVRNKRSPKVLFTVLLIMKIELIFRRYFSIDIRSTITDFQTPIPSLCKKHCKIWHITPNIHLWFPSAAFVRNCPLPSLILTCSTNHITDYKVIHLSKIHIYMHHSYSEEVLREKKVSHILYQSQMIISLFLKLFMLDQVVKTILLLLKLVQI